MFPLPMALYRQDNVHRIAVFAVEAIEPAQSTGELGLDHPAMRLNSLATHPALCTALQSYSRLVFALEHKCRPTIMPQ